MAVVKKKRLFKIASEINVGKDTIIDYLEGKGFKIERKPTFSLTVDMVEAVYDKFKREMHAAEIQREKIEKRKQDNVKDDDVLEQVVPVVEVPVPESAPAVAEEVKAEVAEKESVVPETPKEEVKKEKSDPSIKILGKIDLEEAKPAKAKPKKSKRQKPKKAKPAPIIIDRDKIVDEMIAKGAPMPKKAEKKAEVAPEPVVTKSEPKKEKVATEKPKAKAKTTKADKENIPPKEDKKTAETSGESKPKKKRKSLAEVELSSGKAPQLRGLTVLGKIDLQKKPKKVDNRTRKEKSPRKKVENLKELSTGNRPASGSTPAAGRKKNYRDAPTRPDYKKINKKKRKSNVRAMVKDEDVNKAIKDTLAKMGGTSAPSGRNKNKLKRKVQREEKEAIVQEEKLIQAKIIEMTEFVTTADLASLMNINPNEIILKCMELGLMVTLNQRLDKDTITLIADDYEYEVKFLDTKAIQKIDDEEDPEDSLQSRSPIVTVMGHVDHGKTSLLDYIRHENVVAGEAGGITQHIAAYSVKVKDEKKITFLDTPGHEAFTAMRARGAQVTDLVVLIVAADDSVMPQTVEAISHSLAANVPIVVAINKVDKPDARPERIKQQLADQNILIEEWGGKYQCVEISAKKGTNIDQLMEKILIEAEMLELKANPDRKARCAVIEAHMDKGFGPVATIIVEKGTLKVGDPFVSGIHAGKVRALFSDAGKKIKKVGPANPVFTVGFDGVVEAGDILAVVNSDTEARTLASERHQLRREQEFRQIHHLTLDDISAQIQLGGVKELPLIIKGDVSGSVEALSDSLLKQSTDEVKVNIIHQGVGPITETDVSLAMASKAVIIGFQINPTPKARLLADNEAVEIRLYSIIYDCINEIHLALEGLLTPELKEEIISTVEIRRVFKTSKTGSIAGCYVLSGKITRNDKVRLLRDGLEVYNGKIHSLKREKDDVKEVDSGFECGVLLDGYNKIEEGDIIESYKLIEIRRTL